MNKCYQMLNKKFQNFSKPVTYLQKGKQNTVMINIKDFILKQTSYEGHDTYTHLIKLCIINYRLLFQIAGITILNILSKV